MTQNIFQSIKKVGDLPAVYYIAANKLIKRLVDQFQNF
jgi:hypothetical protein